MLQRRLILDEIASTKEWDVLIVGGGATGLGAALESASRGYRTLLLEARDFAKATSSRSTKLVHGGVRYLQQGNVKLVLEALRERGRMLRNAPHLAHRRAAQARRAASRTPEESSAPPPFADPAQRMR